MNKIEKNSAFERNLSVVNPENINYITTIYVIHLLKKFYYHIENKNFQFPRILILRCVFRKINYDVFSRHI